MRTYDYILCVVLIIVMSGLQVKAQIMGTYVPNVIDDIEKANQSQTVWFDGSWWGVFKSTSGYWSVYKYNDSNWELNAVTGIQSVSKADIHLNETSNKLYIMVSKGTEQFTRLTYNSGTWTEDSGFPVIINLENILGNDPACIAQSSDGDLFIFYASDNALKGLHSTDDGQNWTMFTIANNIDNSTLTDGMDFQFNGQGQIGLFVGQGDTQKKFLFFRLPDNQSPYTQSNWIAETLPIDPVADDHVNLIKDSNNNLYMIGKTGTGTPIFYLYKRNNTGSWSYFEIEGTNSTRPALAINEDSDELIIVARNNDKIEFVKLNKNSLTNVTAFDWQPILQNGTELFNNPTVSYQLLTNQSDVLVCGENVARIEIWYNFLYAQDVSLPVFLSSFSVNRNEQGIVLEWITESEIDNAYFIIERSEDNLNYKSIKFIEGKGTTSQRTKYNFTDQKTNPEQTYFYRLYDYSYNGKKTLLGELQVSPLQLTQDFELSQNFPNPFNSKTKIKIEIGSTTENFRNGILTDLSLFNSRGQKIKTILHKQLSPGTYFITINSEHLNSGVYFYRLINKKFTKTKKMIVLR